jgi:hypothetical protein
MHLPKTNLSFLTSGIFAYICSEGIKFWSISSIDFKSILDELVRTHITKNFNFLILYFICIQIKLNVILNLKIPEQTFYLRNSFLDLKPLLDCYELPAVQLCAVWDIHFLCSKKREIYCKFFILNFFSVLNKFFTAEKYYEMLIEINGHKVIKEIHEKTTNDSLKSFCEQTLNVFDEKYPDLKY